MDYEIDEAIVKKADMCPHNQICLTAGGKPHCEIKETINDSVFFLKCRQPSSCAYQHSFGSAYMCSCPVRQEIYKKYRI